MSDTDPSAVATVDRNNAHLLNVTQLRELLERLERHGCGHWEIDIAPAAEVPDASTGQPDLAFDLRRYGITSADALGDGSVNFVLLTFAPAAK
jgi:hypothetical protein